MTKSCRICGQKYTRKIEHIKRTHKLLAYKQFIALYIDESTRVCQICQNTKPLTGKIELHVLRKHLGRAAKDFAQTF